MGVLTVVALALAIAFLAYTNPGMFKSLLPDWLTGTEQNSNSPGREPTQREEDDTGDGDSTPKAEPERPASEVPTFTLSGNDETEEESNSTQKPTIPMFPAANSAQRASGMPPPPRPSQATSGLMLPPGRPSTLR